MEAGTITRPASDVDDATAARAEGLTEHTEAEWADLESGVG